MIDENLDVNELQAGQDIVNRHLKRQHDDARRRFVVHRRWLAVIIVAILLLAAGAVTYLLSPASDISSIKIVGNNILSDDYVLQMTGLSYDTKFAFVMGSWRGYQASKSPLIDSVDIVTTRYNGVIVTVHENEIIGYRYDSEPQLVLADGTMVDLQKDAIKDLSLLPILVGFSDEKVARWAKPLAAVSTEVRSRIAEISDYSLSWDSDMIKCTMDDGYRVYLSLDAVPLLDQYIKIISSSTSPYACIYLDASANVAVMRNCADFEGGGSKTAAGDQPESEGGQGQ